MDARYTLIAKMKPANEWEQKFLKSIGDYMSKGWDLSEKQNAMFEKIMTKNHLTLADVDNTIPIPQPTLATPKIDRKTLIKISKDVIPQETGFKFFKHTPRPYQIDAYSRWKHNNFKGSISAGTGLGKTLLGCMVINKFPKDKILIVVPTEVLLNQWFSDIKEQTGIECGLFYGKKKEFKQVTISIINSVREMTDIPFDTVILDEAKHIPSDINQLILNHKWNKIMALSATFERDDLGHELLFSFAPLIFEYEQKDGIDDGYLAKYNIINIATDFVDDAEEKEYDGLTATIKMAMERYHDFNSMRMAIMNSPLARDGIKATTRRRMLLSDNNSKVLKAVELIEKLGKQQMFVFNEFIATAEKTYHLLSAKGYKVGMYHSKLKAKERREMMEKFRSGEYNIIVSCRCLDEGVNVPESSIAIIVGRTQQPHQAIQRVGRILRKSYEGKVSTLYNIYVKGTADENWLKKGLTGLKGAESVTWLDENQETLDIN